MTGPDPFFALGLSGYTRGKQTFAPWTKTCIDQQALYEFQRSVTVVEARAGQFSRVLTGNMVYILFRTHVSALRAELQNQELVGFRRQMSQSWATMIHRARKDSRNESR